MVDGYTTVWVPDNGDWSGNYKRCLEWIHETWPAIRMGHDHDRSNPSEDYYTDFDFNGVFYVFKDKDKALMFKLACGGR